MKTILVLADSFRRDHLGTYGGRIHTPYLDRFAALANVFERYYAGSYPTGPNRRDVHLGKGCAPGCAFNPWKNLEADEVPFAHRLYEAGIPTMMVTDVANQVTRGANMMRGFKYYTVNRGQEGDGHWCDQDVDLTPTTASTSASPMTRGWSANRGSSTGTGVPGWWRATPRWTTSAGCRCAPA